MLTSEQFHVHSPVGSSQQKAQAHVVLLPLSCFSGG